MPTMERSCLHILESNHDEHEAAGDTKENSSQTRHGQKQSMGHQSLSSHAPQLFDRSTGVSTTKGISQNPRKSDGDNLPNLNATVDRISDQMFGGGDGGSQVGRAVQRDPGMDQPQDHEQGSADASDIIEFYDSRSGNVGHADINHPILAKKSDADSCPKWCSICLNVEKWMIQGDGYHSFDAGTWEDLQARAGCPSCDDILSMKSEDLPVVPYAKLRFYRHKPKLTNSLYSYHVHIDYGLSVCLNASNSILDSGLMGSVMDPNWFDIARLKMWLAFCDQSHGERCHGLPILHKSAYTRPRYLIDVAQGCLIEPLGDERYFALSYVWGTQQDTGMATKENINFLMQKGTISIKNTTFRLPRTVEDAIQLTELLGERFLWIDRLCIIQDDLDNWHSQIKKMGSIYTNAYCTFVASGGSDANHGITGLNQHSGPRQLLQRRIRYPSLQMVEYKHWYSTPRSIWNKRGWTFQELKLSRRVLFFDNVVHWACQQSHWEEFIAAEPERGGPAPIHLRKIGLTLLSVEPWPDFEQWVGLVDYYCQREFRFEEEAGAAFTGIEEILSHCFPGGFCFGMPEFYFDIALLWKPETPQKRRKPKPNGSSYLPSWSFLGWKDGMSTLRGPALGYGLLSTHVLDSPPPCNTRYIVPKVDWMQIGPSGRERRIRNNHYTWKRRQDQSSPEAQAKLGWQRRRDDNYWTHVSIPGSRFPYPVPLGFQTVTNEYHTWSASLRLRSQSTFLTVSGVIGSGLLIDHCRCTELVTHTGEWAGILHMNVCEVEDIPLGEKCELVAISCGSVLNNDAEARWWLSDEWELDGRPKATETYEFYNVMWIRRESTYVVRENVGRVEKSVWDRQELQEIDVELR